MELNLRYSEGVRENGLDAHRSDLVRLAFPLGSSLVRVHRFSFPEAESRDVLPLMPEHLALLPEECCPCRPTLLVQQRLSSSLIVLFAFARLSVNHY
jgi:hypothetical protein